MLFGLHAEKITNRCPPASPELATRLPTPEAALSLCAGTRLPSPRMACILYASISGNGGQVSGNDVVEGSRSLPATSLPGALKKGEYSGISTAVTAS